MYSGFVIPVKYTGIPMTIVRPCSVTGKPLVLLALDVDTPVTDLRTEWTIIITGNPKSIYCSAVKRLHFTDTEIAYVAAESVKLNRAIYLYCDGVISLRMKWVDYIYNFKGDTVICNRVAASQVVSAVNLQVRDGQFRYDVEMPNLRNLQTYNTVTTKGLVVAQPT